MLHPLRSWFLPKCSSIFMIWAALSLYLFPLSAHPHTKDSIPDPPGLFQFKTVSLKTVNFEPVAVDPACDEDYRLILESGAQSIWTECSNIGKAEPSDCQRSLFQMCTDAAKKLRGLQPATCKEMVALQATVKEQIETHSDQQNTQADNQSLNAKAASASGKIAQRLKNEANAVMQLRKQTEATLAGSLCAANTSLESYLGVEKKVVSVLKNTEARLQLLSEAKIRNAKGFQSASNDSAQNQTSMQSANPQTQTGFRSNPNLGMYEGSSSSSSKDNILKAAAVGVPAAALLGVALANGGFTSPMVGTVDTSGPSGSDAQPPKSPASFEKHDMVYIDRAFTDREKAIIKSAYARIPQCHLPKLKNITIENRRLGKIGSSCIAGLWTFQKGQERIYLTPFCHNGVTMNTTVHEFLHAIGFESGRRMYSLFNQQVRSKHPGCAVTDYARTSPEEDFSESGRLALVPEQIDGKRTDACVSRKVSSTLELIRSCK